MALFSNLRCRIKNMDFMPCIDYSSIRAWWNDLSSMDRAMFRHCKSIDDAYTVPAFHKLIASCQLWPPEQLHDLGMLAILLAMVREDFPRRSPFIQLREYVDWRKTKSMDINESRFCRVIAKGDSGDFFNAMKTVVTLLNQRDHGVSVGGLIHIVHHRAVQNQQDDFNITPETNWRFISADQFYNG